MPEQGEAENNRIWGGESTREQLLAIAKTNPEAVVDLLLALQEQVRALQEEVWALKGRLAENSRNSYKPPGSDGFGKPPTLKSLRLKSVTRIP